ncbi:hypothetical protein TNCV_1261891 [Trichonephila clavipes]|nr:hypothetical protein TNCV_1261891 [Trichonephila clavipes]
MWTYVFRIQRIYRLLPGSNPQHWAYEPGTLPPCHRANMRNMHFLKVSRTSRALGSLVLEHQTPERKAFVRCPIPPNTLRVHTENVLVKSVGPKVLWAVAAEILTITPHQREDV